MVGHQAISEYPRRHAIDRLAEKFQERGVVGILVKEPSPPVTAVEDMVNQSARSDATYTWHPASLPTKSLHDNQILNVPFFLLSFFL